MNIGDEIEIEVMKKDSMETARYTVTIVDTDEDSPVVAYGYAAACICTDVIADDAVASHVAVDEDADEVVEQYVALIERSAADDVVIGLRAYAGYGDPSVAVGDL